MTSKVYYEGNLRTRCIHLKSGNEIITDAPIDNSNLHLHRKNVNIYLCFTAILAIIFVVSQFLGLGEIIK